MGVILLGGSQHLLWICRELLERVWASNYFWILSSCNFSRAGGCSFGFPRQAGFPSRGRGDAAWELPGLGACLKGLALPSSQWHSLRSTRPTWWRPTHGKNFLSELQPPRRGDPTYGGLAFAISGELEAVDLASAGTLGFQVKVRLPKDHRLHSFSIPGQSPGCGLLLS